MDYIKTKGLGKYYPSLGKLINSMGNIMYYEHGRLVENVRIADGADINVLNGYEDMKFDNMSGVVDVFRNLKGDPELIRQYMAPLFVAVKAREKIGQPGIQISLTCSLSMNTRFRQVTTTSAPRSNALTGRLKKSIPARCAFPAAISLADDLFRRLSDARLPSKSIAYEAVTNLSSEIPPPLSRLEIEVGLKSHDRSLFIKNG